MKLLKALSDAGEAIQALFFILIIGLASVVSYSQGYDSRRDGSRTAGRHFIEYGKTFLSGMLAFIFTLLISESQGWNFSWTCLVGGMSVLFSRQFFELLFAFAMNKIFGGGEATKVSRPDIFRSGGYDTQRPRPTSYGRPMEGRGREQLDSDEPAGDTQADARWK